MREMSVTEQRYKAVQGVLADGRKVSDVAGQWSVSRRTMHRWLARYEGDGLEGLRTVPIGRCIARIRCRLQLRYWSWRCDRARGYWGARRIALELAKKGSSQRLRSRR